MDRSAPSESFIRKGAKSWYAMPTQLALGNATSDLTMFNLLLLLFQFVFNRLENNREICTKIGLAKNSKLCQRKHGALRWSLETYVFSNLDSLRTELPELKRAFYTHAGANSGSIENGSGKQSRNAWIIKPTAMNRGRGILIKDSYKQIEEFLMGDVPRRAYVVQKYIERPLLIDKRKFDIRMFLLITSCPRKVFLYPEGYVRTCSVAYDQANLGDQSGHLTNDDVQKDSSCYGSFEDCNKMSFGQLQEKLSPELDFSGDIYPQMVRCLEQLFSVSLDRVVTNSGTAAMPGSFELMGVDFMIDSEMTVYLLEINTSPALFRKGQHLKDLLPLVVEETVQKALDPFFPQPNFDGFGDRLDLETFASLNNFQELSLSQN